VRSQIPPIKEATTTLRESRPIDVSMQGDQPLIITVLANRHAPRPTGTPVSDAWAAKVAEDKRRHDWWSVDGDVATAARAALLLAAGSRDGDRQVSSGSAGGRSALVRRLPSLQGAPPQRRATGASPWRGWGLDGRGRSSTDPPVAA